MRFVLFFVFSLLILNFSAAQVGNEWINYSQPYVKIPVAKDGMYKVTYADLQTGGFPLGSASPKNIQLFHRGKEISIQVKGEADNIFDATDYILFYGEKNDGTLDAELYQPTSSQPHTLYNLYSDTTSYFLTVGSIPGKRIQLFTETNDGTLSKETFHQAKSLLLLTSNYSAGQDYGSQGEVFQTAFDLGEGWMSNQIQQGSTIVPFLLTGLSQRVTSVAPPELEIMIVGRGDMDHQVEVYAGARLLNTINFSGFNAQKFSFPLQWTDIVSNELTVGVKVLGVGGEPDRVSVAYCNVRYAQDYNMSSANEKTFYIPANPSSKAYVEIQNPPVGLLLWDVTDPENVVQIGSTITTTQNAVVPAIVSRKVLATSVTSAATVKPVHFRQIIPNQHNYVIISHPALRSAAGGYSDPVQAYAAYRASEAGGNYDTLLVNIDQVYDQFNYGEKSPLAIFHFMKFLSSSKLPDYLFIIGKGLDVWYGYHRNPTLYQQFQDFIPTAGWPGSDNAFTAGLAGTTYEPAVPTGRITVTKPQQVADYLNKIMEMESLPFNSLWRKDLLHLSGGIKLGEPQQFKSYLQDFQTIAESNYLGGKVTAMSKLSTDIQPVSVSDQVNAGLNAITFFGHSAPEALDYEIGYVSNPINGFNNKGKYPLVLINGCDAGAYFLNGTILGEDWVLTPAKGAIAFIAHSAYGFVSQLRNYSEAFYSVGYGDSTYLSKSIGQIQKETARRFFNDFLTSPISISQAQQMVLLGDPAYKLFGPEVPDLEINDSSVSLESLDGKPITALTDSFAVRIVVRNFGQSRESSMKIEVNRTLNDNNSVVYDSIFTMTKYTDTLAFIIRRGRELASGTNNFRIKIDPDNAVDEVSEENNVATITTELVLNATKNLFPFADAIVSDTETKLSFQYTNLLSGARDFVVELDTINTFDSPYKKEFRVTGDVFATQSVSLLTGFDTLAYYWRTKLEKPLPQESDAWLTSSFTFIENGPEGWAQVHFPQFLSDQMEGMVADSTLRRFSFVKTVTNVSVKTFGSQAPNNASAEVSLKIDGFEQNYSAQGFVCRTNTINLVAFDRKSAVPYIGLFFEWFENAGRDCGRQPFVINNFASSQLITGNGDDIIAYINNVAEGDSVLLFTMGDPGFSTWPAAAKDKFAELGIDISQLEQYTPGTPLVVFGRKGSPLGTADIHAPSDLPTNQQTLEVTRTITGYTSSGKISSRLIGPAKEWQQFTEHLSQVDKTDLNRFDITGVKTDGHETVLFEDVTGDVDLQSVSADEYPYLKIEFTSTDDVTVTPSQIDKWLVSYTPVAEGILLFKGPLEPTELNEGQTWHATFGFANISPVDFPDSLTVVFETFTKETRKSEIQTFKVHAPVPGDTTIFSVTINTVDKGGLNDFRINVNPNIIPEQYYDNNKLELISHLNVIQDKAQPVLQVTVDGRQLENGDFVSPNPPIKIKLWDGTKFLPKKDTSGIKIFLTYPCAGNCIPTPIFLSRPDVVVHPATSTSDFEIEFNPTQLPEGDYTLQVEANNVNSTNKAKPYIISFVVKYDRTVVLHPPYPNPSNDRITFPIEITGDALPEDVDLQIMNANGQHVTRIGIEEFSPIHSGKNYFVWHPRDQNGNPLPNGVYIYKEVILFNQQQVVQFGKLVLVR